MSEAYRLAFEQHDRVEAARRYAEGFALLAPGELGDSMHHGEYAAVLYHLGQLDQCLAERRRTVAAAELESQGDATASVEVVHRYFLGQHLASVGRPAEAIDVVMPSLGTRGNGAALLLTVKAEVHTDRGRRNSSDQCSRADAS